MEYDSSFYRFGLHISRYAKRSILITGGLGFAVVYPALHNALDYGFPSATGWYMRDSVKMATDHTNIALLQLAPCFSSAPAALLVQAEQLHIELLNLLGDFCYRTGPLCLTHTLFDAPQQDWLAILTLRRTRKKIPGTYPVATRSLVDRVIIGRGVQARCLTLSYFIKAQSEAMDQLVAERAQQICARHADCESILKMDLLKLEKVAISWTEQMILLAGYSAVLAYLFISFRRLRLVRSRIGLAVTSFVSITFAVLGAFDLVYLFDESSSLSPLAVLPFMVMVLETENIFRATNAVTRIPRTLSPAQRMSEAMRTVGPTGLHALGVNLCIIGMFGYVANSALRQFCGILAVALVLSYALHLTFFCAIMSIDVRRTELMDLLNERHQIAPRFLESYFPVSTRRVGSFILTVFLFICWSSLPASSPFDRGNENLMRLPVDTVLTLLEKQQVDLRILSYSNRSRTRIFSDTLLKEIAQGHPKHTLLLFVLVMLSTYALVTGLISRSGQPCASRRACRDSDASSIIGEPGFAHFARWHTYSSRFGSNFSCSIRPGRARLTNMETI
ncbi:sterol-sensing domain of SREBP cleavage-activation-domain-containing protein [Protomyces lactucae-debilis]|uniref:Sterol-sensing domain of SREBP cleavage-activation-domain-containing protein n=1 Tax=Protomyces lactucae-debilis TaxID=2754530 RepID=A0A1Y2ES77_PROLT|nr:sterol-sensing domain of SREBP cleavage-activation-domain-containing protein [Protomyces lactucae-debilis]ORY73695.1 sterol-sensing domain of SREBP cleavage-activation-domain-containing protein [Protomyces lactucae-debilis]